MGCAGCSTSKSSGSPDGCGSNGGCGSGGCNRLNTYDWLAKRDIQDAEPFQIVEVSFKNGSRKAFFQKPEHLYAITGDTVVVDSGNGYDVGLITLSGELVRMQMKKKRVKLDSVTTKVLRIANERDLQKMEEARNLEGPTRVKARVIARTLGLEMKIGDVEFQADRRKATFYYTADGRVDFRELIRHFAKEFRIKIEMRQIGARQESARIGGIGSCGRELCCSTWLTDFKSVSTAAARYQNLAINQAKLSGQCGRLKCCLNYELDTYLDALEDFPKHVDKIKTQAGVAILIKTDIFKGLMYYVYDTKGMRKVHQLKVARVKEIQAMNKRGEFPPDLVDLASLAEETLAEEVEIDYDSNLTGIIELPPEERKKRRRNRRNRNKSKSNGEKSTAGKSSTAKSATNKGTTNTSNSNNKPATGEANKGKPSNRNKPNRNNRNKSKSVGQNKPTQNKGTQKKSIQNKPTENKGSNPNKKGEGENKGGGRNSNNRRNNRRKGRGSKKNNSNKPDSNSPNRPKE